MIHPGIAKQIKSIEHIVSIPKLNQKIVAVNAECSKCNTSKHFNVKRFRTIGAYDSSIPFQKISLDIKKPIPTHKY